MAIDTNEILAAYVDAGKYARGETTFAAVCRHSADDLSAALAHAEDVLPPLDSPGRGMIVDLIDVLEMALRD